MADQTSKETVLKTLIGEYCKAFPNDEIIFIVKERGSGYCSLNGNMAHNVMEQMLSEIGKHIIVQNKLTKLK